MAVESVLTLQNITKSFGDMVAVDNVNFELQAGEIHAILGENGAGKSTLMKLIYGLYQPTGGEIYISGKRIILNSPRDAIANGIGMVHQHFMLIENLTVAENIALSVAQFSSKGGMLESLKPASKSSTNENENPIGLSKFYYRKEEAIQLTETLSGKYNLSVNPTTLVRNLSVGLKQRVEILKALAVNARILILDEPTAVLSPNEVADFFTILYALQADNHSIIFISHKMKEVLEISDRISVLRRGKKVYHGITGKLSARELAREMLGEEISEVVRKKTNTSSEEVLKISELVVLGRHDQIAVQNLSLETHRGEIVGIAGVDGNGQRELAEAIMGLQPIVSGSIEILGTQPSETKDIRQCGVGYIPEDRRTMGIILSFTIAENLILNVTQLDKISNWGVIVSLLQKRTAQELIESYDIRPPFPESPTSSLSGGNQQKIVLAREISPEPDLLIAVNPTRGLDINATHFVYQNLLIQRDNNKSVLLISTELDEVLEISDRFYIMSSGRLIEATKHRDNIEALGLMMTGEAGTDV